MNKTVADPLLGAVLEERYRVRGMIARGGMATVYHALDERLERTVAVKVIHPAYATDPSFVERFGREARSIARLSHPNVVAVYDQGSHNGLAFLVMEYVPGRTLRQLLTERGKLAPEEAIGVLGPLLSALAAAHRVGMVHRDVKPENVLLSTDGTVKVADFGLARIAESSRATSTKGVMFGTVAYVAPEIVTVGTADPRADVYAAGIVLFEMLTGQPPYRGETPVSVAYQHVHAEMPAPSERTKGVPYALDDLVLHATRREPGARPPERRRRDAGRAPGRGQRPRDDGRAAGHRAAGAPLGDAHRGGAAGQPGLQPAGRHQRPRKSERHRICRGRCVRARARPRAVQL
ncbi:protein kinase domain-containing protein [Fodinicola feengrottensis]|uniref:protein kinase domain-containing protein n=1 Tax=Fodinicola feengrottensis TaxID=435914 RepID=UPI0013D70684|nr:protein kinase [Fodinicola feengrottensis]